MAVLKRYKAPLPLKRPFGIAAALLGGLLAFSCSGCRPPAGLGGTKEALQAVLSGEAPLLYAQEGGKAKPLKVGQVPAIFSPDSAYAAIDRFAILDLDGDGETEAVLRVIDVAGDMGGHLVLRREGDALNGYAASYRDFESLKTDGTYCYSLPLGTEWGACRPVFGSEGYCPEPFIRGCMADEGESVSYLVEGRPVSEQAYDAAMARQDAKPDAKWYAFSEEGLRSAFA